MVRSRLAASAVAALAIGSIALAPVPTSGVSAAGSIGFEVPTVVDPIHTNGEPDIAVDTFGRVFASGPTGTGTQRSTWFGSVDGGQTFRVMAQKVPPTSVISIPAPQPGGGDTDINFDRSGKQYFTDLYALACLRVATTGPVNPGAMDSENLYPGGCGTGVIPGADRQWLAVYDPSSTTPNQSLYRASGGTTPLIYLAYNNLAGPQAINTGSQWNMSTNGLDYTNATAGEIPPTGGGVVYSPFGADGYPAIDQVTGDVFQAAGCDAQTCGSASNPATPGLYMNIGTPDAAGVLHFRDDGGNGTRDLTKLVKIADTPTGSPDVLFSVLSMDASRNLFAVWAIGSSTPANRQIWVSASSASSNWLTWSPALQVSDGSTSTGDATNVFPWIKAGGNGMADAVWYGSNKQADPSDRAAGHVWNVFMSQVRYDGIANALSLLTVPPVKVSPHPMHYKDICLQGSQCITSQGNRNLADFFAITADTTGAAEIVYDDTSNGLAQPGFTPMVNGQPTELIDHSGAGVITIARQSSGLGLLGNPVSVSGHANSPRSGIGDRAGDALYPVIGGSNQAGMDIRGSQLQLSADGQFLNVTTQVTDLSDPAGTLAKLVAAGDRGTTNLQYVTRWQMNNTIYYAAMEITGGTPSFYAGLAQSIDLCSVSACFPHVITYPESGSTAPFTGKAEQGTVNCPSSPSADNPCSLTIKIKVADIGSPSANSLLEEVGAYSLSATLQEALENNTTAEADTVPLEIDGACCYNFMASVQNGGPGPCHEGDGDGHVSDGHAGTARVTFDQDACEDGNPESVQESDSSTGDNFQSTNATSVVFNDALSNVTIVGTGTHNGNRVTFTLVAVNGPAGIGAASLTLSDGYAVSGILLSGSVQLQ